VKNHYRYSVDEREDFEHAYAFESVFDEDDGEWLAQEAAEDFHNCHDGWEAGWDGGKDFWLWHESGKFIGRFNVTREYEPRFSATPTTGATP
jgi:hypothetical protein